MVSTAVAEEFLSHRRLALVGVSRDPKAFSVSVYRELKAHGYEMVPVNPRAGTVDGDRCLASVADLPPEVEGVIVMVPAEASAGVVQACIDRGVPRVWLHRGAGPSSVSEEAVALCHANGIDVVEGACPMMFLDDTAWIHRAHRWGRRVTGHLTA